MEISLRKLLKGGSFGKVDPVHSCRMAAVRGKDTSPEMIVRRLLHSLGYRYRLHVRQLPGTPDIVFPSRRKIVDVKGCFWHMHGCAASHVPSKRRVFWSAKLARNKARDARTRRLLRALKWHVLTVWECELANRKRLERRLVRFLSAP